MTQNRKNIQNIFIILMVVIFAGEIYISPFTKWFRFSFAVVILSILLLYFKDISIVLTTSITGICVSFFRAFIYFIAFNEKTFVSSLIDYFPVIVFYIVFGILFYFLNIRNKTNNIIFFILSLWICDIISNFVETMFRKLFILFSFDKAIFFIIVVGFIRSIITSLIYYIILHYKKRYEKEQKENRYKKLLVFVSKLKAEIFFLKKSREAIENTMKQSYNLYENIQDKKLKEEALNIAKNIHEIKKDYYRVSTGIENTLLEENENVFLDMQELFEIIEENTGKIINSKNKDILLHFHVNDNFEVHDFYSLISILNNLIINSIDAIKFSGKIKVEEYKQNNKYVFEVLDTGLGIEKEDLDVIYQPGYSTKYDLTTGNMSDGLGLSHVKQLVENNYQGKIYVHSQMKKGTSFKIIIPSNKIKK